MGTQSSFLMRGSAVSPSPPNDFQPNSHKGLKADPQISLQAMPAPPGRAYAAVGIQRALDSEIGLPSSAPRASWMLVFVIQAEVRRSLMMPLLFGSLPTLVSRRKERLNEY